jgi:hypothetical protein
VSWRVTHTHMVCVPVALIFKGHRISQRSRKSIARPPDNSVCGEPRESPKTAARGTPPDTDGESMIPESHRSSGSALDGLRVDSDLIGVDPDAICATLDMMSG